MQKATARREKRQMRECTGTMQPHGTRKNKCAGVHARTHAGPPHARFTKAQASEHTHTHTSKMQPGGERKERPPTYVPTQHLPATALSTYMPSCRAAHKETLMDKKFIGSTCKNCNQLFWRRSCSGRRPRNVQRQHFKP